MLKISGKELDSFRKLQETKYEIGGKIILNTNGVKKTVMVNGSKRNVLISQFPLGLLWFHTHPNIPVVKSGQTAYSNVIKELIKKKGKDFTVDTIVQPISDDDLIALTSSIREQKTCMMFVFTPEGVYLMSQGEDYKKKTNNKFNRKVILKIEKKRIHNTVSKIKLLPNFENSKVRKELLKKARQFLRERDELVIDSQEILIPKLNKAKTVNKKVSLMKNFQKTMGKKVAGLANQIYPYIYTQFFPWTVKSIKINSNRCVINND